MLHASPEVTCPRDLRDRDATTRSNDRVGPRAARTSHHPCYRVSHEHDGLCHRATAPRPQGPRALNCAPPWAETLASISGLSRSPRWRITARIGSVRVEGSSPARRRRSRRECVGGYAGTVKRSCAPTRKSEEGFGASDRQQRVDGSVTMTAALQPQPRSGTAVRASTTPFSGERIAISRLRSCRTDLLGNALASQLGACPAHHRRWRDRSPAGESP